METLWSISTTIREAERIVGFLVTATILDGQVWNKENQCRFQILLIKNRQYLNDPDNTQAHSKLSAEQSEVLDDKTIEMSYEMAESIFLAKEYNDPPMRGRQSMSPLVKLGLIYYETRGKEKIVRVSDIGRKLATGKITFEEFMLEALLKHQYPNPADSGFKTWNTKPFINTLRLIKWVNKKCEQKNLKQLGISTIEFGIFALSLKHYSDVEQVADDILTFRQQLNMYKTEEDKKKFTEKFIAEYLSDFNNPIRNCREYTDNMIRYLRLTKYIFIRGKYNHTYIDLEPRRMLEINAILQYDNGKAKEYSIDEWNDYMGTFGAYELPFETLSQLTSIAKDVIAEINAIELNLGIKKSMFIIPDTVEKLKAFIEEKREYRTQLQNLEMKKAVHEDSSKIDETIESLTYIIQHNKASLTKKYSIELEKWTNVALNIINDCILIKPNSPVGDDNEPIYTAPNGVPDIECYYEHFGSICEVTTLTNRDQWHNEGQPVMRHLRDFENKNPDKPSYCLFIAPSLHRDTINTFYTSVKYEYEGAKQKIIPITIKQLNMILNVAKRVIENHQNLKHDNMKALFDSCTDMSQISNSTEWLGYLENSISNWCANIISSQFDMDYLYAADSSIPYAKRYN